MGLGNGNAKSGDKGSNFNYQFRNLQLLGEIATGIIGIAPPGGLSTEATSLNILAAINNSNQDIEVLLVRDNGNGGIVVKQIQELVGGAISYEDVNGNPYVPVGPLEYLDPSAVLNLMLSELLTLNAGGPLLTEATFTAEDFAQELTLAGIKSQTDLFNFLGPALVTNVTSSALPTGAATEATLLTVSRESTQVFVRAAVESLETKLNTLGQKASVGSAPVVLSTEQQVILDAIKTAVEGLDTSALATEVTLVATNALLTTIDGVLDAIKLDTANLDVALSTLATESTLLDIETLLTSLDGKDFATQTTLEAVRVLLVSLEAKDFATETSLVALSAKFNSLGQKASAASTPVVLSTEQEVILDAIKTAVENLDLDVDGLATEVTLEAIRVLTVTIDGVLDAIKLDTANLDVALSTISSEATALLALTQLQAIKANTDPDLLRPQGLTDLTGTNAVYGAGYRSFTIAVEAGSAVIDGVTKSAPWGASWSMGENGTLAGITVDALLGTVTAAYVQ